MPAAARSALSRLIASEKVERLARALDTGQLALDAAQRMVEQSQQLVQLGHRDPQPRGRLEIEDLDGEPGPPAGPDPPSTGVE